MESSKLYIYDKSSELDRMQAAGRFNGDDDVLTIGVQFGIGNLVKVFDMLANNGPRTFNSVVVQTHGGPGRVWFGDEPLGAGVLREKFVGFSAMFPRYTRLYFDGCNVAEGAEGTEFLRAAGEVFLTQSGGEAFGWTTVGHAIWGHVPFIGGHTLHFGGDSTLKKMRFFRGGQVNWPDSHIP